MKKLFFAFLFALVAATMMTSCNTISGVGRDVSVVGSDVSAGAKAVGRSMSSH